MKKVFSLALCVAITLAIKAIHHVYFAAPTNPATNLSAASGDGDRITFQWTNGNGARRIVVVRKDQPVSALPVNGVNYNANTVFGNGNALAAGEYVVYNNTGTSVTVTNLVSSSSYYFAIFEYNGSGGAIEYLMTPATIAAATLSAPTGQPSNLVMDNITGHSMHLTWTNPLPPNNGAGRLVLAREGSPVNVNPTDMATYNASAFFGQGTDAGNGNYVVYKGNNNNVTVDSLKPNTTYYFSVFEYKGSSSLVYNINNPPSISTATLPRPTQSSSTVTYPGIEGNSLTLSITKGNGARRLVIAKAGGPVTFQPQDGQGYNANTIFGSGDQVAPGEYVVSNSTTANVPLTNLSIGTTYYFAVYEYDGTGSLSAYLTSNYLTSSQSTATVPTAQATNIQFTNITSSSVTITWQNGDGAKRLVVMRRTDPVNSVPSNLVYYSPSTSFQLGSNVGANNYSVYSNNGNTVTVTGLTGGSTYHVAIFEYNGNTAPVYLTSPSATSSFTVSQAPTNPAQYLQFTNIEGNRLTLQWGNGNGNSRMIIARAGTPVTATPVDGQTYTANGSFISAPEIAPGQRVVYNNGVGLSTTVFNLDPGTTYYFAIFEYNTISGNTYYLTSSFTSGSQATVSAPTVNSTSLSFSSISGNSIRLSWLSGNGSKRIVIARAGSDVTASPADFNSYSFNSNFSLATQIGTGNYVVYNGTGNNVTVFGLDPDTRYYFKVYEYNGATYPVYLQTGALGGNQKTNPRPSVAASALNFYQPEGNKMTVRWTNGDGTKRILVGKQGSPVTALPQDGVTYTANSAFGSGGTLAAGEFILSDNEFAETAVTNLIPNTTYYFAIFEYDGTGNNTRYQTVGYLNGSGATLSAPTEQSTNVLFSSIGNTTVSVNWTAGDGEKHLVIARKGAPVNVVPADLHFYPANTSFGTAITLVNGDNYAVYNSTGSNTPVSNLLSGTTYYFAVYDYNGFSGPVYKLDNPATGSVTTLGPPLDPATTIGFTNTGNNTSLKITWQNGSGQKRLVLMKDGGAVNIAPANNVLYNANSFFGSGEQIGSGNFAVYSGAADNVTVTNIIPGHVYHIAVFEYNQFASGPLYLVNNPATAIFSGFALPVKLSSFSGQAKTNANLLTWKTVSEINVLKFVVERSANGIEFLSIGTVNATGNSSSEQVYSFEDAGRFPISYYRLSMIDRDGKTEYSPVIKLQSGAPLLNALKIYPSVSSSDISVNIETDQKRIAGLAVIDMSGRVIKKETRQLEKGVNQFTYDISDLTRGTYFIQVAGGEEKLVQKFIRL